MREPEFVKVLHDLVNSNIGLFLLNQHFLEGVLLAVKQDHVVMDKNQKVHYISLEHIKTLSKNSKDHSEKPNPVPYLESQLFIDILSDLKNSYVSINDSEKDAHFGVLSRISEDHIVLINHAELLYIPIIYISNIHGVIPEGQIHLTNQKRKLTNQQILNDDEEIKEELQDIVLQQEIDHTQEIVQQQDADQLQVIVQHQVIDQPQEIDQLQVINQLQEIVQQQEVDQLQVIVQHQVIDQPQAIVQQEDVVQPQDIFQHQVIDQFNETTQQQDMLESHEVFDTDEEAELQAVGNINVDTNETTESFNIMLEKSQEIQNEDQIVEDYEGIYSINTFDELENELPEEITLLEQDAHKVVVEVDEYFRN
ncbi:hypothetical protein QNH10_06300 [Sporosarcina thermotolerans]|uniref:hypothetical protein n=1 Tax=Sporosarcina thermotolerans TaxID=633404 RepID=UPI0024BC4CEE|nr:hypothetical protein [Sporosarcina thermotolerans]WHT49229.1 hypothetical protein QNH10_06300 [Sporosarcina thermotolerans]